MKLYINAQNNEVTWNKKNYLLYAAKKMLLDDVVVPYENGEQDYVLNIEPFFDFKKGKKWTGIWEIDTMLDRGDMSISNWVACDTVFTANNNIPERMKTFDGELITLFQACEPEIHRRTHEPVSDFVFSGTIGLEIYRERERAMKVLRDEGFSFIDHGKGHSPTNYINKISDARVQFIRSGNKEPFNSQVEQRFFECLAIGPVLKDYHPDLEQLGLVEGKDYYSYKNDKEMVEKMRYLIDNPEFAKQMAINGRKKALLYHTYEHRLLSILQVIREHHGEFSYCTSLR